MSDIKHFSDFIGTKAEKFHKDTLFMGDHLMLGINCLEPGQVQAIHDHADQDKAYIVMDGVGRFTVGETVRDVGAGHIIWAKAGVPHGVENPGQSRLAVLVCMAPPPGH